MVVTSHSQSLTTPRMWGYQALQKQNYFEGRNRMRKPAVKKRSKQYFIWIVLLLIELPKCEVVGNYLIEIFSGQQYIRYQMIASHSSHDCLIPFSNRTIASQNPASDRFGFSQ